MKNLKSKIIPNQKYHGQELVTYSDALGVEWQRDELFDLLVDILTLSTSIHDQKNKELKIKAVKSVQKINQHL